MELLLDTLVDPHPGHWHSGGTAGLEGALFLVFFLSLW